MIALLARRLLQLVPTLLATSMLMFFVLSLGPSPLAQLREFSQLSPDELQQIAHRYGWDRPKLEQYATWMTHFAVGDLGTSVRTLQPAWSMISERLPLTLTIALSALVLSVGVGVPLGAWAAVRRDTTIDRTSTLITLVLMATPGFFLALILQILAVKLRDITGGAVFYTSGVPEDGGLIPWIQRLTLPVLTLSLTHVAMWVRYQRGELLGVLGQAYVTCARAKGLPERVVLLRHAMRNAVLPIITLLAIDMGKLVAGAVVVESVFGLPGIGSLLLDSVNGHDTVVVLDILMLVALSMVASNTLADMAYGALDPRIRVEA